MNTLSIKYNHHSVSLLINGIPDVSLNNDNNKIGIVSSWKLEIVGVPPLEGKKQHLEDLISVVIDYTNSFLLGIGKACASPTKNILLSMHNNLHKLTLTSSQKSIEPLNITLDDSELADLTKCFDELLYDDRVKLNPISKNHQRLNKTLNLKPVLVFNRIRYSLLGSLVFISFSGIYLLFPLDTYNDIQFQESQEQLNNKTKIEE